MAFSCIVQADVTQDADFLDHFVCVEADQSGKYEMLSAGQIVPCTPRDLSGSTLTGVIAPSYEFSTVIHTFSSQEIPISDPINGTAAFDVPQAVVAFWPAGRWVFIVRENRDDGSKIEVMRGPFIIHPRPF